MPVRTASSLTLARRPSANSTVAVSLPWLPGAIVTNIGRSPAKGFVAPRTARPTAWGMPVSFPNASRGKAATAAPTPTVARSSRPRVSPTPRTVGNATDPGGSIDPVGGRPTAGPRPDAPPGAYGQVPLT